MAIDFKHGIIYEDFLGMWMTFLSQEKKTPGRWEKIYPNTYLFPDLRRNWSLISAHRIDPLEMMNTVKLERLDKTQKANPVGCSTRIGSVLLGYSGNQYIYIEFNPFPSDIKSYPTQDLAQWRVFTIWGVLILRSWNVVGIYNYYSPRDLVQRYTWSSYMTS